MEKQTTFYSNNDVYIVLGLEVDIFIVLEHWKKNQSTNRQVTTSGYNIRIPT